MFGKEITVDKECRIIRPPGSNTEIERIGLKYQYIKMIIPVHLKTLAAMPGFGGGIRSVKSLPARHPVNQVSKKSGSKQQSRQRQENENLPQLKSAK